MAFVAAIPSSQGGPDLDVVERSEIGREQRADRTAAGDADPHGAVRSGVGGRRGAGRRTRGSENSRPPVMPDGRKISIVAMTVPRMMSVVPCGRSSFTPT